MNVIRAQLPLPRFKPRFNPVVSQVVWFCESCSLFANKRKRMAHSRMNGTQTRTIQGVPSKRAVRWLLNLVLGG